jgi:fatty acid desaturase
MPTLVERLSSRLLSTDDPKWNHPRIAKTLMTILTPTLLLAGWGWGIGLVAQHSMILGGIPPIVFGVVMLPIGFVILALIDAVSSGQRKNNS